MPKKKFQCGHSGKGQYCHRCAHADVLVQQADKAKDESAKTLRAEAERLKTVPSKAATNVVAMPSAPVAV